LAELTPFQQDCVLMHDLEKNLDLRGVAERHDIELIFFLWQYIDSKIGEMKSHRVKARRTVEALKRIGAKKHTHLLTELFETYKNAPFYKDTGGLTNVSGLSNAQEIKINNLMRELMALPSWKIKAVEWKLKQESQK